MELKRNRILRTKNKIKVLIVPFMELKLRSLRETQITRES